MERESRPSRCTFSFLVVVGDALIEYLLEAGWKAVRIAEGVGCHEKTVRRLAATFRAGPENRSNKRRKTDRNAPPVSSPILAFSASGTPWEVHRRIQEKLGI